MTMARGRSAWWIALAAFLAGVFGILVFMAQRRPPDAPRETTLTRAETAREAGVEVSGGVGAPCGGHTSCSDGGLCVRAHCLGIGAATPECRHVMVRFARGTSALSTVGNDEVERAARCLKANRRVAVSIEPSSDMARTSTENAELTASRRTAVREGLERRGVTRDQLRAIDLAEDRP